MTLGLVDDQKLRNQLKMRDQKIWQLTKDIRRLNEPRAGDTA
jgi:hypothetical protein